MPRATKMYKRVGEEKSKAKALRNFKDETV